MQFNPQNFISGVVNDFKRSLVLGREEAKSFTLKEMTVDAPDNQVKNLALVSDTKRLR